MTDHPVSVPVLVTGGTGFLGRRVVAALIEGGHPTDVLVRTADPRLPGGVRPIQGSLPDLPDLSTILPHGVAIIHLAARTGKGRARDFERANVAGTRAVLEMAQRVGASRLIFVSSIAATFPDRRYYPYAESKRAAESLVRQGGVPFDIVRPTVLLGGASPAFEAFRRLGGGAFGVCIGRGAARTQPIHVEDAARHLVALLHRTPTGQSWDLGGPEVLTVRSLLSRVRRHAVGGPADGSLVSLPARPLRAILGALDPLAHDILPLTAGQLAFFLNDSTVKEAPPRGIEVPRLGVEDMLVDGDV